MRNGDLVMVTAMPGVAYSMRSPWSVTVALTAPGASERGLDNRSGIRFDYIAAIAGVDIELAGGGGVAVELAVGVLRQCRVGKQCQQGQAHGQLGAG
jgi:hypothetical protein